MTTLKCTQTSDGHDTSVSVAGKWCRDFLEPLINDKESSFWSRTLVLITFDESETYPKSNRVFSLMLGDAVPDKLVGTTDKNWYNHYSEISTVAPACSAPAPRPWAMRRRISRMAPHMPTWS